MDVGELLQTDHPRLHMDQDSTVVHQTFNAPTVTDVLHFGDLLKHPDGTEFSCPGCWQTVKKGRPWFIDYRYGIDDSVVLVAPRNRVHGDLEEDYGIELEITICDWHHQSVSVSAHFPGSPHNEMQEFMLWEHINDAHPHRCYECKLRSRRKTPWWHQFTSGKNAPGCTVVNPPPCRVLGETPENNSVQFYLELCDWHK